MKVFNSFVNYHEYYTESERYLLLASELFEYNVIGAYIVSIYHDEELHNKSSIKFLVVLYIL